MKKEVALFIVWMTLLTSCGGRLPEAKTAHHKLENYFEKYGKKYRKSDFGQHKLDKVEIFDIEEVKKNVATVNAYVHLKDGPVYPVRVTLQKKTYGWKVLAWENLGEQKK